MKKKIFLFFHLIALAAKINAQAPSWLWAKKGSTSGDEYSYKIASDPFGNVCITGYFSTPTITFGSYTLTNSNIGTADIFIVKYDAAGNVLWAKQEGDYNSEFGESICIDNLGNIYITGYFDSPNLYLGNDTLTRQSAGDVFVIKHDPNGNILWARSGGNPCTFCFADSKDICCDQFGNVLVTGNFYGGAIDFGSASVILPDVGENVFTCKFDSNGNVLWARGFGGFNNDISYSICTDNSGNAYVTGGFLSGGMPFASTTLANASGSGTSDCFLVKYDGSGNEIWAKRAGGIKNDSGTSICSDPLGNIYLCGIFTSSTITFGSTTLNNLGSMGIFITKYDNLGNVLWSSYQGSGGSGAYANAICSDSSGDFYLLGGFFDPIINFGTTTLTNIGTENIYVAKFNSGGTPIWAQSAGGSGNDVGEDICSGSGGLIFVTGEYQSAPTNFGATSLSNAGSRDVFIATLGNITEIRHDNKSVGLKIFPNPCHTDAWVVFNEPVQNATLVFCDLMGRPLKQIDYINEDKICLKRNDFHAGIYLLKLICNESIIANEKIVFID